MENIQTEKQLINRKKVIRKAAVIFICIIVVLTFFSSTINNFLLPEVECDTPSVGVLTNEITAEGEVFPVSVETVYAYGNWRLKSVKVQEGQEVTSGTTLAIVDAQDIQLEMKKAELNIIKLENELKKYKNGFQTIDIEQYRADCDAANKAVQKAEKELKYQKELYEMDAVAMASVIEAQDRLEEAKADYEKKQRILKQKEDESIKAGDNYNIDLAEMEAELEVSRLELQKMKKYVPSDGVLKAAVDGTVKSIPIQSGATTSNGQILFEIVKKQSGVAAKWTMDIKPASKIKVGDTVEFYTPNEERLSFNEKVKEKKFLPKENLYEFSAYINDTEDKLEIGQALNVSVRKESTQYDTLVPKSSIIDEAGKKYIFILKERDGVLGKEMYVVKQEVNIAEENDFYSAITGVGFNGDEKIVKFSTKALSNGLQVKLR